MRIGFCDDDRFILSKMEQEIRKFMDGEGIECAFFAFDSEGGLLRFMQDKELDLLFLDIEMPGKGGIGLAKEIGMSHPECEIAFCTNYLEFATEVYETRHCYYILKKEFARRLPDVIRKVRLERGREGDKLCLKHRSGNELVPKKEIVYIERRGKKSYVYLEDGGCRETTAKLDEILAELRSDSFARCHNSYIVALDKVMKYSRQQLLLQGGVRLSISRPYVDSIRQAFARWNWKKM